MKGKALPVIGALIVLAAVLWIVALGRREDVRTDDAPTTPAPSSADATAARALDGEGPDRTDAIGTIASTEAEEAVGEDQEPPMTPEEREAAAEEAAVESFDALTDKWMEPSEKGVTMEDVGTFAAQFKKVPKDRQEECLQRALNLVPDENVMLLAGILMDKSQPKELTELVFNDILNRDEDVKKPILQQVFRDKTHPCWADTAWILDVAGETF